MTEPDRTESLEQQLARLAAGGTTPQLTEPTLPVPAGDLVIVVDRVVLHDLAYAAASTYLRGLNGLTIQKAQLHATRIAESLVAIALASDHAQSGWSS